MSIMTTTDWVIEDMNKRLGEEQSKKSKELDIYSWEWEAVLTDNMEEELRREKEKLYEELSFQLSLLKIALMKVYKSEIYIFGDIMSMFKEQHSQLYIENKEMIDDIMRDLFSDLFKSEDKLDDDTLVLIKKNEDEIIRKKKEGKWDDVRRLRREILYMKRRNS